MIKDVNVKPFFLFLHVPGLGARLVLATRLEGLGGEVFLEMRGRMPVLQSGCWWNEATCTTFNLKRCTPGVKATIRMVTTSGAAPVYG